MTMKEQPELTEDQLARIAATLKRIRGGLDKFSPRRIDEPAHVFAPETQNDR